MFEPENAFLSIDGQTFTVRELKHRLAQLRAENTQALPAEVGVRELLDIAHNNKWLIEEPGGHLRVAIRARGKP